MNNLFVAEEEDIQDKVQDKVQDDPVIESIPLVLGSLRPGQSLHVLQYPGRPSSRPITNGSTSIKEESKYLEVKVPLDVSKFFDGNKVATWGEGIGEQLLHGVLDKTDGSLYAAQIVPSSDGGKMCVLVPIDSTAQLRSNFKYLDDLDSAAQAQRKSDNPDSSAPANVQILQTSAKGQQQDTAQNALGESLRHVKRFNEEEWSHLRWTSAEDAGTAFSNADDRVLEPNDTRDSYLGELLR